MGRLIWGAERHLIVCMGGVSFGCGLELVMVWENCGLGLDP